MLRPARSWPMTRARRPASNSIARELLISGLSATNFLACPLLVISLPSFSVSVLPSPPRWPAADSFQPGSSVIIASRVAGLPIGVGLRYGNDHNDSRQV